MLARLMLFKCMSGTIFIARENSQNLKNGYCLWLYVKFSATVMCRGYHGRYIYIIADLQTKMHGVKIAIWSFHQKRKKHFSLTAASSTVSNVSNFTQMIFECTDCPCAWSVCCRWQKIHSIVLNVMNKIRSEFQQCDWQIFTLLEDVCLTVQVCKGK
jgi:hypothetical protein